MKMEFVIQNLEWFLLGIFAIALGVFAISQMRPVPSVNLEQDQNPVVQVSQNSQNWFRVAASRAIGKDTINPWVTLQEWKPNPKKEIISIINQNRNSPGFSNTDSIVLSVRSYQDPHSVVMEFSSDAERIITKNAHTPSRDLYATCYKNGSDEAKTYRLVCGNGLTQELLPASLSRTFAFQESDTPIHYEVQKGDSYISITGESPESGLEFATINNMIAKTYVQGNESKPTWARGSNSNAIFSKWEKEGGIFDVALEVGATMIKNPNSGWGYIPPAK